MDRRLAVVFMRFDNGGPSDKLYDEVIAPACEKAGFKPYRVDRDPEVDVPIETLKRKIRDSAVCIADLTSSNPNVFYETGLADAFNKKVVFVMNGKKIPFDVRHRSVIFYTTQALGDFHALHEKLVKRLKVIAREARAALLPTSHDVKVLLALLCAPKGMTEYDISQFLGESGIQVAQTILSVRELEKLGYISGSPIPDFDGNPLKEFKLTDKGLRWLRNNREGC